MIESLLDTFHRRDRLALSRLLSLAARGESLAEIDRSLTAAPSSARVVALTGSGGVGKSTLVGKLIEHIRGQNQSVAVLACDPQSPLSGGALLGDRFRMPSRPDDGVFIRSLAAVSGRGAVAEHLPLMVRLLEAFGFDVILIETVGAGQGDTAVHGLADVVVLLLQPETGDDLQWEKAGVLEVAGVVAVNKADLPGADEAAAQVRSALDLAGAPPVPVVRVSGRTGEGITGLWQAVLVCPRKRPIADDAGQELLRAAQELLATRYARARASGEPEVEGLLGRWRGGGATGEEARADLLRLLSALKE